jgi:hypothetical protein
VAKEKPLIGAIPARVASAISVPAASALVYRNVCQSRIAKALVIVSLKGIVEDMFVCIGCIEQWIGIRGQDRSFVRSSVT